MDQPHKQHACLCIAGTHSGVGKTTLTLGILSALRRRGLSVQPFKCGPDYIDPGHHTRAAGRTSRNLDTWMMGPDAVQHTFHAAADADLSVIEGVMGLFDGASSHSDEGSTAHVCKLLNIPVILVINAKAMARSVAALVHGFSTFDPELRIAGVIANHVGSGRHANILRESLEAAGLPPLLGAIPLIDSWRTEERHLGLVTAAENRHDEQWFTSLADDVEEFVEIDRLLECSSTCPKQALPRHHGSVRRTVRLGIARDQAFQFYYEDNLDLLRARGVELVPFSPLNDSVLPPDLAGLYIGGGYPELYANALSANGCMRAAIAEFAREQRPIYGECGGLMYLCESLTDSEQREWPMCGVLPAATHMENRLRRLGYVEAKSCADGIFGPAGTTLRGHEFHWSDLTQAGLDANPLFDVTYARGGRSGSAGITQGRVYASYVHLHFASCPSAVTAWTQALRGES